MSVPRLGWDDVTPSSMPALIGLADRGVTASLSVKTIGRRTTPVEGYASIATGTRATAPEDAPVSGYAPDQVLPPSYRGAARLGPSGGRPGGRTAAEAMRSGGHPPGAASVVVPGIDAVTEFNRGRFQGAKTGALGEALHGGRWMTAVIANHDGPTLIDRTAAVALADRAGRVDRGTVAPDLTATAAPGSSRLERTDPSAVEQALAALPSERLAAVVEIGDLAWADAAHVGPMRRRAAAARTDRVLARVLRELDRERDLIMVISPAAPIAFERPTPFVMAGPGVGTGLARSATTRRAGYVTLPDIGPTVLTSAGIDIPTSMNGTAVTGDTRSTSGEERVAAAIEAIAQTRFTDRAAGKFIISYPIVFESLSFLTLVWLLLHVAADRIRSRHTGDLRVDILEKIADRLRPVLVWVGVVISAVPALTFLLGGFTLRSWHLPIWFTVLWSVAGAVGAIALVIAQRWLVPRSRLEKRGPWMAVVVTAAFTWLVLVIDVLTGARLQFDTPIGNSPTVAGRFAGMGNIAFALLAATTLLLAWTIAAEMTARGRRRLGVMAAAALFAIALVVDGAPGLGSDVGGVLVLAPVAVVSCWLLTGRRLSWRPILIAGLAAAAVVVLFALVDLSRPAADRTHLGRLLAGDGQARNVVIRKALAAGGSFLNSISLAFILFCVVALTALFWNLRRRDLLTTFAPGSAARHLAVTATALAVAGTALNDSGIIVAAMMAAVLAPAALVALLPRGAVQTDRTAPTSHELGGSADTVASVSPPTSAISSNWGAQATKSRQISPPVRGEGGGA